MSTHTHVPGEQFPMASHFPADVNSRFFGALQLYPQGPVYEALERSEQVILLIRRHPIALLRPLLGGLGLILALLVVVGIILFVPLVDPFPQYEVILAWFLLVFTAYYLLSVLMRYVGDVWIITTERIIDVDVNTFGLRAATEFDLSAVAGASQVRGGGFFFGGIDRGAVLIRIIGEDDVYMPDVPMSIQVAQVISELAEIVQRSRGLASGNLMAPREAGDQREKL